ncbi:bacteriocin biosynthesis cyclodehydratase, SagC [Streptococcus pyogenes MGAS2111]|nr:bacteriocin biosynthesis cyclodehydratase, SagC [Streptococcus pyogenes MGAS2111]
MNCLSDALCDYQSIIICQERLNIMMLRHLNEVSVAIEKTISDWFCRWTILARLYFESSS